MNEPSRGRLPTRLAAYSPGSPSARTLDTSRAMTRALSLRTKFLLAQVASRNVACVAFLMCPFRVRGRVPVETTAHREPEDVRRLRRVGGQAQPGGGLAAHTYEEHEEGQYGPSSCLSCARVALTRPIR